LNWRERKSVVGYVDSIEGRFSCWLFLSDWIDDELIIENDDVCEGLERWSILFVVVTFGIFIIFVFFRTVSVKRIFYCLLGLIFVEDFTCFFGCRWSSHSSIGLFQLVKSICWRLISSFILGKETIIERLPA